MTIIMLYPEKPLHHDNIINNCWWQSFKNLMNISSDLINTSFVLTLSKTTNFRPFETERVRRQQFQIWRKWQKVFRMVRKHCGKRRNCSLRAISPFSHCVFKRLALQTRKNQGFFRKGLNIFKTQWYTKLNKLFALHNVYYIEAPYLCFA